MTEAKRSTCFVRHSAKELTEGFGFALDNNLKIETLIDNPKLFLDTLRVASKAHSLLDSDRNHPLDHAVVWRKGSLYGKNHRA